MSRIKNKIRIFHAILARTGLMDYKKDMLAPYGVESTKELNERELDELISNLQRYEDERKQELDAQLRKLRSQVLTILQRMGIYKTNEDWRHVNKYLQQPRIAGKLLYEMNPDELQHLIKKLRSIERKKAEKAEREKQLAQSN